MIYIFDTSSLIVLCSTFYPSRFPTLWTYIDGLVSSGRFLSVRDVDKELKSYHGDNGSPATWANSKPQIFTTPNAAEMDMVSTILAESKFKHVISQKQVIAGKPFADPFVIAKAKVVNGTVVTQEVTRPHSAKIPDVCAFYNISCCDLEGFMTHEGLQY